MQSRVAGVLAAIVAHLFAQTRSGLEQTGCDTILGEGLSHVHRRLHHQDRSRIVRHVIADGIE